MDRNPCPVTSTVPNSVVESPKPQMLANFVTEETPKVERESPEPNCAICLGKTENKSFTDSCLHQFCFSCLLEWSKVKPECPLCKQNFKSIIHNIRSNDDYDKYDLQVPVVREPIPWPVDNNGQRFRYRTTLTVDRRDRLEPSLSMRLSMRVSRPLFLGTDAIPSSRVTHRRNHRRSTSEFRTSIYRHNLWVNPLPDVTGRYRECSPEFYRLNPAQVHRLVPWLNRELNVLQVPHQRMLVLVQDIINMISSFPINSAQFQAFMTNQVGVHAPHFIHEFYAFARSPYDMIGFDETAEYHTRPAYATEVQAIDSDSDSDVVVLSPGSGGSGSGSGPNEQPHSSHQVQPLNLSSNSSSSQVSTRSPEPGPSQGPYPNEIMQMLVDQVRMIQESNRSEELRNNAGNNSTQVVDSDSDDCMIVGYVKPRHERTPEIYTLSSDAEGVRQETVVEDVRESDDADDDDDGSALYISTPSPPTTDQSSDSDFVPHVRKNKRSAKRKRPRQVLSSSEYQCDSPSPSPEIPRRGKKCKSKGKHRKSKPCAQMSSSDSSDDSRPAQPQPSKRRKSRHDVWRIVRKQEHDYSRDCYDPPYTEDELATFSSDRRPRLRSIVISKTGGPSGQREHSYSSVASSSRSSSHYHESKHHRHKVQRRGSKKRKERKRSESSSPIRTKGKKCSKKRSHRNVDSSS